MFGGKLCLILRRIDEADVGQAQAPSPNLRTTPAFDGTALARLK
jgi:hypothetical protein